MTCHCLSDSVGIDEKDQEAPAVTEPLPLPRRLTTEY